MKFLIPGFSRQRGELCLWQAFDEEPTIGFRQQARIQNRDQPAIVCLPDQAANSLSELDQCVRQREFVEGIATAITNVIAARLGNRMSGWIERQAGDDHLGQRVSGDVDTGPKTIGAK